jgi:tight adherence protein B
MPFFDLLINRINDAFSQHTTFFIYGVISITGIIILIFDLNRFKNNQVSRQVSSRIGKDGEKDFDLTQYFSKYLSKQEDKIRLNLEKANVLFTVKEYMSLLVIAGVIGALIGLTIFPFASLWKLVLLWLPFEFTQELLGRLLAAVGLGFLGTLIPRIYLYHLINKKRKMLSNQIQDALLNIADALRSGHVISEAIKIVGNESPYPIGAEFTRAYQEMEAGKTLESALIDLKTRIDIQDFTMAVNAIEIQYEVGGKLGPLLRNMVKIIAERQELKKEINRSIASSKMVGIVLLCAPIFFAVVFTALNKEQFTLMFEMWQGMVMLGVGIVSYLIAAALIAWIIHESSKDL